MNNNENKTEYIKNEKEYFMLREEIMHHKKRQNTMATFAYTIVASLFGVAATADVPILAAIPVVFVFPLSLKFFESRYSIALLSTYMRVFLSESDCPRWENNLSEYYSLTQRQWHEKLVYVCSKFDFFLLCFACPFSFWVLNCNSHRRIDNPLFTIIIIIQIIITATVFYFTCKYYSYENLKNNKMNNWLKLKIEKEHHCKKNHKFNNKLKENSFINMFVSLGLFAVSTYEFVFSKILSFETEKKTICFNFSVLLLSFIVYYISIHCDINLKKKTNDLINKISNDLVFLSGVSIAVNTLTDIYQDMSVRIVSAILYLLLTILMIAIHIYKFVKDK